MDYVAEGNSITVSEQRALIRASWVKLGNFWPVLGPSRDDQKENNCRGCASAAHHYSLYIIVSCSSLKSAKLSNEQLLRK